MQVPHVEQSSRPRGTYTLPSKVLQDLTSATGAGIGAFCAVAAAGFLGPSNQL